MIENWYILQSKSGCDGNGIPIGQILCRDGKQHALDVANKLGFKEKEIVITPYKEKNE